LLRDAAMQHGISRQYRVVSIDGGGIRGLVTTILLQRIVATPGLEHFLDSIQIDETIDRLKQTWNVA